MVCRFDGRVKEVIAEFRKPSRAISVTSFSKTNDPVQSEPAEATPSVIVYVPAPQTTSRVLACAGVETDENIEKIIVSAIARFLAREEVII